MQAQETHHRSIAKKVLRNRNKVLGGAKENLNHLNYNGPCSSSRPTSLIILHKFELQVKSRKIDNHSVM